MFCIYLCTGLPSGTGGLVKNSFHLLRQQMSLTEIMNSIHSDASLFLESTEDTGLQEHTDDNCLYCVCIEILGFQPSNQLSAICSHSGEWLCPSRWTHLSLNLLQSQVISQPDWSSLLLHSHYLSLSTVTQHLPVGMLVSLSPVFSPSNSSFILLPWIRLLTVFFTAYSSPAHKTLCVICLLFFLPFSYLIIDTPLLTRCFLNRLCSFSWF